MPPSEPEIESLRSLLAQGRYREAEILTQAMTERFPRWDAGWKTLASLQQRMGRPLAEAEVSLRRALQLEPEDLAAHGELGNVLKRLGRPVEAEASFRRALQIRPDYAELYNNLGGVLQAQGKLAEAEASYRAGLRLRPDLVLLHGNLGNLLQQLGRLAEAEASFRRAVALAPGYAEMHNNLASVLLSLGRLAEAEASCREGLELRPDLALLHSNLGSVLQQLDRLDEAEASFRRALALEPDCAEVHNNLGGVCVSLGRFADAETSFRHALRVRPDYASALSNLLLSLNYRTDKTREEVFALHREFGVRFGTARQGNSSAQHRRPVDPAVGRRLKVGYLSPDFRRHSIASFIAPLLREHDRGAVEVFCYSDVVRPDAVTSALQRLTDQWRDVAPLADDRLLERIREDEIDILVDLAGHTAGNRLPVFARHAAPVQVTWLGYPNTTGLEAMSHRFVDAVTDPPGEADRWAVERLIRLDHGFLCFEPAADAPSPSASPCFASGAITFGSFNNPAKLSLETLDVWARVLDRIPGSRLLLKGQGLGDEAARRNLLDRFAQQGGDPRRTTLLAQTGPLVDHLAAYGKVDIALDPFPYNGATTTCEALWMGVPTVTLLGNSHAGRVGASLLTQVDLTDLIASSAGSYVDIAATLAADPGRLSDLRQTLRERMRASSLCDAKSFARRVEAAFRALWREHCGGQSAR